MATKERTGEAIDLFPAQTAAFTTAERFLDVNDLPARLFKTAGLATTETIKVESKAKDAVVWTQLEDENGLVQIGATGRNVIPINVPGVYRFVKSATAANTTRASLVFGVNIR